MESFQPPSSNKEFNSLVGTSWLAERLQERNVKIVESSWALRPEGKSYFDQFLDERIPGSVFFDIDKIADHSTTLPHMLPSPAVFEKEMSDMGISSTDHVVVYDRGSQYVASARCWWTFKAFGHDKVSVLDGGFLKWKKDQLPTESGPLREIKKGNFKALYQPHLVQTLEQMLSNIRERKQIADARPAGRFKGVDPEPRPNLRLGHIPGSQNVPSLVVLTKRDPSDGYMSFFPPDQLKDVFKQHGIDPLQSVACTCGSGVTASVVALALHLLGNDKYSVYDGSWSEWGSFPDSVCPAVKDV